MTTASTTAWTTAVRPAAEPPGDTVRLTLPDARVATARQVIRELAARSASLPDAVRVVVVHVSPAEALTVELVTAFAVSRRLLGHRGRQLVLDVTGAPASAPARALLASLPTLRRPGP